MVKIIIRDITPEEKAHFQPYYTKHNVIGYITEAHINYPDTGFVIVKMKQGHRGWTPEGTARDCGDHYIIARYSRYDRLDKKTMTITEDVEDR